MISPIFMIRAYLTLSLCLFSALISAKPVPVIFDTDIGSDIDDVFALSLILKSPELDLKLITTVSGDTHYRAKVAAKFLQISKRTDIPVAPGRHAQASAEFLRPWINDFSTTTYPGDIKQDGIAEIISLLKAADNPVTIIVAGPMTNIAEVLQRAPELATKMRLVGMHGSIYKGYDDNPVAEYNVQSDVAAFQHVLHANVADISIAPLDTCRDMLVDGAQYQALKKSNDPQLSALFDIYPIWAERVTWDKADYLDTRSSVLFDTVAGYLALPDHAWLPTESVSLMVTDDGFTLPAENGVEVNAALRWENLPAFKTWFTQRMLKH